MKKATLFGLIIFLVIGLTGLLACNGGGTEVEEEEEQQEEEETGGQTSESELTWSDVPVYPGANEIAKGAWSIPPAEDDDWAKMEWRYYETGDSAEKVASYYKSKMGGQGWSEQGWMEAGMFYWGYFTKNSESDGAMVWTGTDNDKTVIALMRATK